ncbi:biopolymer transporter ExbD [Puniceicoccaceae bacterium K14]|nr:biopolymer transporter ExbD [Puniceicoccaceae bacterium K14]
MGKNKKSLSSGEDVDEINISPLIDMVFILLIFFIVTTVFVEEPGVEINKPIAINSADLAKNCVLIAITQNDQVMYGGDNVGVGGIRTIVRKLVSENDLPVIIQADQLSKGSTVIRVVDECKLAQATEIYVSTLGS